MPRIVAKVEFVVIIEKATGAINKAKNGTKIIENIKIIKGITNEMLKILIICQISGSLEVLLILPKRSL